MALQYFKTEASKIRRVTIGTKAASHWKLQTTED